VSRQSLAKDGVIQSSSSLARSSRHHRHHHTASDDEEDDDDNKADEEVPSDDDAPDEERQPRSSFDRDNDDDTPLADINGDDEGFGQIIGASFITPHPLYICDQHFVDAVCVFNNRCG
jgi:hypothetical protein